MSKERRTETREALVLPVRLGPGIEGVTRDISAAGLFLATDSAPLAGSLLDLEFRLDSPSHCFRFVARGSVVRTESQGDTVGVAVEFHDTCMQILA